MEEEVMSLEKEEKVQEEKNEILEEQEEQLEEEQLEEEVDPEVVANTKQLYRGCAALLVIALLIIISFFFRSVPAGVIVWESGHEKIEELKKVLIDGVSIEDRYDSIKVYNWSYGQDGDEFLKVETENGVDVYNTTDQELDDSYDLDQMRANFIGLKGMYESDEAELEVLIDDDYEVTFELCFKNIDEEADDEELDDELDGESDEESDEELDGELDGEEAIVIEEELIAVVSTEEELEELEELETEEDLEDLEEEEDLEDLEDLEEEEYKIIEYIQILVMRGEIVAETMVEVLVGYDLVVFEWLDEKTIEVNPVDGFRQEQIDAFPELCEALTGKIYTFVEVEEEEIELFDNGYEVEIIQNLGSRISFELSKDGEVLLEDVYANKVSEDNDFAIYQDEEYTIYFKEYDEEQLLVSILDAEMSMLMQWIVEFEYMEYEDLLNVGDENQ